MLIRMFVLKVINNEKNKITHREIIDRIAEQILPVIAQECKRVKIVESCEFTAARFLICLFTEVLLLL